MCGTCFCAALIGMRACACACPVRRSPKAYEPQVNLSATVFISEAHAERINKSVHSPGPVYMPKDIRAGHVPTPALGSGPDRFYSRAEPGRL